jgi:uncharacterized membrane protein
MKDTARLANHPIHPMLIPFPIGLWIFSFIADIIYRAGGSEIWADVAYYSMAGGIVGAIIAALPGFVDYFTMKPSRTKTIATRHMLLNVSALILFIINLAIRRGAAPDAATPFVLSIIGVLLIIASGWLGGHMVYVQGMAVDETEVCAPVERAEARGASSSPGH